MKMIVATSFALASVLGYPVVAEATGTPALPWQAEYTTVAALLALITYLTTKVGPDMVARMEKARTADIEKLAGAQKDCTSDMCDNIQGLRDDLSTHLSRHLDLLGEEIKKRPPN